MSVLRMKMLNHSPNRSKAKRMDDEWISHMKGEVQVDFVQQQKLY